MANEEHLNILRQGVEAWNAWRKENLLVTPDLTKAALHGADFSRVDLSSAELRGADLSRVDLRGANLRGANLRGVNLRGARLNEANLREADLQQTDLYGANIIRTNLREVNLREANLHSAILLQAILFKADLQGASLHGSVLFEADLQGSNLQGADLQGALIGNTIFADIDLSTVRGLDKIHHMGPSTIGIDTLQRSGNMIPKVFLRGCGVPQRWIDYIPLLIGLLQPIQFYSCFVGYSSQNEEFAGRLYARMQQEKLRVWFAPEDLKGGRGLLDQIDQAIDVYDKILLVLSDQSLHAKWMINELRRGRQAELAQNRRKLFPIRLMDMRSIEQWTCYDRESETDLAAEVLAYSIPDFSNWKDHDAFEEAFKKLLNDLKAVAELPAPRDVSALLKRKRRELTVLEAQQAAMDIPTYPYTLLQIEDLRNEIVKLEHKQNQMNETNTEG